MAYVPVLVGEACGLRTEVEALVSGDNPDAITDRLNELDERTRAAGRWATFGAEIEFEMIEDPTAEDIDDIDKERQYEEVVQAMGGSLYDVAAGKGEVVHPNECQTPILVNKFRNGTYNGDQPRSNIAEIRTSPASAVEAVKRYWDTVSAIGTVAARHGLMAFIHATHFSGAVIQNPGSYDEGLMIYDSSYGDGIGMRHLAGVQRYLVALRALQLDAGLESGVVVHEAYPSKDAMTAVYTHRLEYRHPIVGIADPRIDMLASLAALDNVDQLPQSTIDKVRPLRAMWPIGGCSLGAAIERIGMYDTRSDRVVMPAQLEDSARDVEGNFRLDSLVYTATNGAETSRHARDGQLLKDILADLRVGVRGAVSLVPESPYAQPLKRYVDDLSCEFLQRTLRVEPEFSYESPQSHPDRRENIKYSSVVRGIFGKAMSTVVPAAEAIARRQNIIGSTMIVTEGTNLENPDFVF